jgi:hypothetical protein
MATELNPDTVVLDMWTRENGNLIYLGRGTSAELAKHRDRCEAAGFVECFVVTNPDLPPSRGPVVVIRDRDTDKE